MDTAIPDALVEDFQHRIPNLVLPDENDRHVLAAAIQCEASIIVTFNQKDFPPHELTKYGLETQHPDNFINTLFQHDATAVLSAARNQRLKLTQPQLDVTRFLSILSAQGLKQTIANLSHYRDII